MVSPLLRTKFCLPPIRHSLVLRARLMQRLDACLGYPLTLVSAPAGFGKSTVVSQWVHTSTVIPELAEHTAWLSLDEEDNDPTRFWEYLLVALEMLGLRFETAHLLLQGQPNPLVQALLSDVINRVSSRTAELILVLDDFQGIKTPAILDGIAFLVEHLPAQMHLILITRSDPSLPLGRLRVRSQLNEIRSADLRFRLDEAAAYFQQVQSLRITEPEIQALEERTEGWIAGLQMAGLSLRDRNQAGIGKFIAEFTGQHHLILDYLTDEVLQRQPPFIQEFLFRTSILSQVCPSLCDALIADDVGMNGSASPDSVPTVSSGLREGKFTLLLEQLEHENLFIVPLDSHRTWYRFHHLFADLLRVRLKEQHPGWIPDLHRRSARWYEAAGFPFEAMQHALSAEDLTLATDVIERTVRRPATWSTGNIARMLDIVNSLPPEVIAARPWLRVYLSGILYVGGQPVLADQMLAEVENSLPGLSLLGEDEREELALYANTFRAFYAATLGDHEAAIKKAEQTLAKITEDDRRVYGHALATMAQAAFSQGDVVLANLNYRKAVKNQKVKNARFTAVTWSSNLADVLTMQGRLHEAEQVCMETIAFGSQEGSPGSAVGYTQTFLAAVYYEWNRLEEAENLLLTGLRLMQADGISPNFGRSHATLALVQQALGKPAEAANSMEIARQIALRSQSGRYIQRVAAYQARLWLMQGEMGLAGQWAKQYQSQPAPAYVHEFEDLTLALVLWHQQQLSEAAAILEPLLAAADASGREGLLIEALAIQALVQAKQPGEITIAQQVLLSALQRSAPEQYLRTYLNLGQPMASLLRSLSCPDRTTQAYRDLLLNLFHTRDALPAQLATAQPASLVEKLSERELEILALIAAGMSNGQIAKKLYLTLNTIRAHSTHIFGKLGVHSRTEAIARAREIGLLK